MALDESNKAIKAHVAVDILRFDLQGAGKGGKGGKAKGAPMEKRLSKAEGKFCVPNLNVVA